MIDFMDQNMNNPGGYQLWFACDDTVACKKYIIFSNSKGNVLDNKCVNKIS